MSQKIVVSRFVAVILFPHLHGVVLVGAAAALLALGLESGKSRLLIECVLFFTLGSIVRNPFSIGNPKANLNISLKLVETHCKRATHKTY